MPMRILSAAVIFVASSALAAAQSSRPGLGQDARRFEVASVKARPARLNALDRPLDGPLPGGRVTFVDRTLRSLIGFAYAPGQSEVLGLPVWAESDGYDVLARAEGHATVAELRMMMQTLLQERFGLRMHDETRRRPGYAVVLSRGDGVLGPRIRQRDADCPTQFEPSSAGQSASSRPQVGANGARLCAIQTAIRYTPGARVKTISSGATRVAVLLESIAADLDRPLTDKTGLAGYYELTLEYAANPLSPADAGTASAPTLVTALREQLGLTLAPQEQDVRVFVVDQVQRPTAD